MYTQYSGTHRFREAWALGCMPPSEIGCAILAIKCLVSRRPEIVNITSTYFGAYLCETYNDSTYQLQVLVTYWWHVCWLRFQRDNFMVGLLHFPLAPVRFMAQYFGVIHGHWVSCGPAMVSYSCWFVQVCVFFEPVVERSLRFQIIPNYWAKTYGWWVKTYVSQRCALK